MEEPQIHMVPVRGKAFGKLDVDDLVKIFNNTVRNLRSKTEVWCHTCWGNPSQQRIFSDVQSYQPTLHALNRSTPTRSPSRPARPAPAISRRSAR
jgi:5-methyltetrahydropteroyltriglutamate--homocysteine methyltransferase